MDILRPGGTFWRIARHRFTPDDGEPAPWMSELAGAEARSGDLGRRPIVVTCDGVVMHVEPAPGRREVAGRIKALSDALYALPWAAGTVDDPSHVPYDSSHLPSADGSWGLPGNGEPPGGGFYRR